MQINNNIQSILPNFNKFRANQNGGQGQESLLDRPQKQRLRQASRLTGLSPQELLSSLRDGRAEEIRSRIQGRRLGGLGNGGNGGGNSFTISTSFDFRTGVFQSDASRGPQIIGQLDAKELAKEGSTSVQILLKGAGVFEGTINSDGTGVIHTDDGDYALETSFSGGGTRFNIQVKGLINEDEPIGPPEPNNDNKSVFEGGDSLVLNPDDNGYYTNEDGVVARYSDGVAGGGVLELVNPGTGVITAQVDADGNGSYSDENGEYTFKLSHGESGELIIDNISFDPNDPVQPPIEDGGTNAGSIFGDADSISGSFDPESNVFTADSQYGKIFGQYSEATQGGDGSRSVEFLVNGVRYNGSVDADGRGVVTLDDGSRYTFEESLDENNRLTISNIKFHEAPVSDGEEFPQPIDSPDGTGVINGQFDGRQIIGDNGDVIGRRGPLGDHGRYTINLPEQNLRGVVDGDVFVGRSQGNFIAANFNAQGDGSFQLSEPQRLNRREILQQFIAGNPSLQSSQFSARLNGGFFTDVLNSLI